MFQSTDSSFGSPCTGACANTTDCTDKAAENVLVRKGRKRKRNDSEGIKQSKCRNSGKEYVTYRGKGGKVQGSQIGRECQCPKKCFEKVDNNTKNNVFKSFWDIGNFNAQNSYLHGLIKIVHVKRRYAVGDSRRSCSVVYHIRINGSLVIVCKKAFASLHGLQNHVGRINNIVNTMKTSSVPPTDKRGCHKSHPCKYTQDTIDHVHKHINLFPKYESHYSRKKNFNKQYMSMDYSISALYEHYKLHYCKENNIEPISEDKYRRIFTEDFNISFKMPKSDTCPTCDELNINIKSSDEQQRLQYERQLELHQRRAEAGQTNIKHQTTRAKNDPNYHVITFDLQQALPTPRLSTGPMFYKRKIWTYNLSVHNCGTGVGHFFVWDETKAKRGSDEIVSCLKKYFEVNDIHGETLIAISDNCCGQNKNWNVVGFWMWVVSTGRFKCVEHHFPVSGHSMLPSDRDFAIVEKHVRRHVQFTYTPDDWVSILEKCCKSNPFNVVHMQQQDFVSTSNLAASIQKKGKTDDNAPLAFRSCASIKVDAAQPFSVMFNDSYSNLDVYRTVNVRKRGRGEKDLSNITFPVKYKDLLPIAAPKYKDILSCLPWIPPAYRPFYDTLKCDNRADDRFIDSD